MEEPGNLTRRVRGFALDMGADMVGIAPGEPYPEYVEEIRRRIDDRGFGVDDYLLSAGERPFFEEISDPRHTLASVRSVVLVGAYAYDDAADYRLASRELRGKIARTYAYYPVVRKIAHSLAEFIRTELGHDAVEGMGIPLKLAAVRIGLGSYGENGLLLTARHGSYIALRAVVTSAPLTPDVHPKQDLCRHCGACRRACPTGALYESYRVDPTLCINALGRRLEPIPPALREKMGGWFRGCDICQEVCPVNRGLVPRKPDHRTGFDSQHHSSHRHLDCLEKLPRLLPLLGADQPELMRRNAAIALGNTGRGRQGVLEDLARWSGQENGPLREYFVWALEENLKRQRRGRATLRGPTPDPAVTE